MSDQQTDNANPMEFITTARGEQLLMNGPLSQAYSEGLDQLYAKKQDDVAMETQALELGLLRRSFLLTKAPVLTPEEKANLGLFYGVKKGTTRISHVVDVMSALRAMDGRRRRQSAVIIDHQIKVSPGQPGQLRDNVPVDAAEHNEQQLRSACEELGVPVYDSFQQFLQERG